MKEPDWTAYVPRQPLPGCLVWVTKKSRGRFGNMPKAEIGEYGLVISNWRSSMGTAKLTFITECGEERAITANCVKVWGEKEDKMHFSKWDEIHRRWMDQTYVPVIVTRVLKDERYRRKASNPYVVSRSNDSALVKPISNPNIQLWISHHKLHPDDWAVIEAAKDRCVSVRMPIWMAKKAGVLGE